MNLILAAVVGLLASAGFTGMCALCFGGYTLIKANPPSEKDMEEETNEEVK